VAADEIVGLGDGAPVPLWEDLSANGYDVAQANPAAQPTYHLAHINLLPAVVFDGSDLLSGTAVLPPGPAWTIFAVLMTTSLGIWKWALRLSKDASEVNAGVMKTDAEKLVCIFTDGPGSYHVHQSTPAFVPGLFAICVVAYDGVNQLVNLAATDEITPEATVPSAATGIDIGGNPWQGLEDWIGDIAEIIIYDSALSDGDRTLVENYLEAKYGLSIS
jgi:hypothetical protein